MQLLKYAIIHPVKDGQFLYHNVYKKTMTNICRYSFFNPGRTPINRAGMRRIMENRTLYQTINFSYRQNKKPA